MLPTTYPYHALGKPYRNSRNSLQGIVRISTGGIGNSLGFSGFFNRGYQLVPGGYCLSSILMVVVVVVVVEVVGFPWMLMGF